jgi:uncharacterized protein
METRTRLSKRPGLALHECGSARRLSPGASGSSNAEAGADSADASFHARGDIHTPMRSPLPAWKAALRLRDTAWAVSAENVEVVRSGFEAWNAGDMAALRDLHDVGVVMRPAEGWPEPGPFEGREACMRWYEQLREAFDIDAGELISVADAGDHVVAAFRWRGAGRGPESSMEFTAVYTVRWGKVVLVEYFWDHDEALEAAGLSE